MPSHVLELCKAKLLSAPGFVKKSRPLALLFVNETDTEVTISEWNFMSGKSLQTPRTEPFSGHHEIALLCEGTWTFGTGVSGTLKVTVGKHSKYVYFSHPFAGCAKIEYADTPEKAYKNSDDGNPKECEIGSLMMYMNKEHMGEGPSDKKDKDKDKKAEGVENLETFALSFKKKKEKKKEEEEV